ncbi:MAG: aldo/keto reductase [Pseudomonadota bacterium]
MRRNTLGRTNIEVSEICLGTMTWGSQNTPEEAFAQIDRSLERGVNFLDTAELYPTTPLSEETFGRTEEIIGDWIERSGRRGDIVLATKIPGVGLSYARGGPPISGSALREAVDISLRRLKTDHIDLYQAHWPNRGSYHFRAAWTYDATKLRGDRSEMRAHVEDVLGAAQQLIDAGKIRSFGLSNETCWGVSQWLDASDRLGLPRVVSTQNEYNLLYRSFDLDLAELSHFEDVGLLAYSPLAAGLLTGKYLGGAIPPGSRASIRADLGGRVSAHSEQPVSEYVALAKAHGLDPATMAVAFTLTRPFMTSSIIGATSMAQLEVCLDAADVTLSDEVLEGIADIRRRFPMPI